jgi:hypothetical protein
MDVAADQEERRFDFMLREDFEQAQGVRIVGAVVIREGELFRAAGQAGEGAAVPLSGGGHGLVAGGGERGGRCGEDSQHSGIVNRLQIGDCRFQVLRPPAGRLTSNLKSKIRNLKSLSRC